MLKSLILGIIQGITEFLPVSSSAHIILFQHFSGLTDLESNLLTNVLLHLGTLAAVIYYFRADIFPYFTLSGWKDSAKQKIAFIIIIATIPTGIIGLSFKKQFESLFSNPLAVCVALFFTGLLLLIAEKQKVKANIELADFSSKKSFIIGVAQGLAVTPGISRSGTTISSGLLLGLKGEDSAKFSFLMMIPAVAGATLLEVIKLIKHGLPEAIVLPELAISILTSVVVGLLSLRLLTFIIKKQKLAIFSYYLFTVSIVCFAIIYFSGS